MGEIYLHVCLMLCCMPGYTNDPLERYSAVSYMVFNSIQAPVWSWSFIIYQNIFSPNKTNFSTICWTTKANIYQSDKALRAVCPWKREADNRIVLTANKLTSFVWDPAKLTSFVWRHISFYCLGKPISTHPFDTFPFLLINPSAAHHTV